MVRMKLAVPASWISAAVPRAFAAAASSTRKVSTASRTWPGVRACVSRSCGSRDGPFVRQERGGGRNAVPRRQALEVPAARGGGRPQALGQRSFDWERRRGKASAALSARGAERQDGRDDGGRALGIEERGRNWKARRLP